MTTQDGVNRKEVICPESTIESANRRNFIRKAAIATTSVGIGGSLLGKALPQSSAKSDCAGGCFTCCNVNGTGVSGYAPNTGGQGVYGYGQLRGVLGCTHTGVGVVGTTRCGAGTAIVAWGNSSCGAGPYGDLQQWSTGSKEVVLDAINGHGWLGILTATPSSELDVAGTATVSCDAFVGGNVGIGTCSPNAKLSFGEYIGDSVFLYDAPGDKFGLAIRDSELRVFHGSFACDCHTSFGQYNGTTFNEFMRLTNQGNLGIGTTDPCAPLSVIGSSPLVGQFKSKATSGDRSALAQFQNACSTAVDWNLGVAGKCNSIKVPGGYFYVQHSTSTTPAISVNKCNNHVGIGIANPCRVLCVNGRIHTQCGMGLGTQTINTTLAINGSVSMKSRQVKTAGSITLSDYGVLANASSGAFTLTLPPVSSTAGACNGMVVFIKKIDSSTNAVTVAAASGDTIEGNTSVVLKKQYDSLQLLSNNSNSGHEWFILSGIKCGVAVS
jgi:hypothetical protein